MSEPIDCVDRQVNNAHGPGCQCEVWLDPMKFNTPVVGQINTIKLSDLRPPRDPFAEFLTDLRDRVIAIEARQRAYGQHDPDCPRLADEQAQAKADWLMGKRDCTCWLSKPEITHLIADGEAVTSCCGRTPFELPRTERITVDPKLGNCEGKP